MQTILKEALKRVGKYAAEAGAPYYVRAALWLINRLAASGVLTANEMADLVTAANGLIGFAKQRTRHPALEQADSVLDELHLKLGEAKG